MMSEGFDDDIDLLAMIRGTGPGTVERTWYESAVQAALAAADAADGSATVEGTAPSVVSIDRSSKGVVRMNRWTAAAAGAEPSAPRVELRGHSGGLRALFVETEEGQLEVRIDASEMIEPLVEVECTPQDNDGSTRRLVTPLASTSDGWAVRASLGTVTDYRSIDLFAPRWFPLGELTESDVDSAIDSAMTYGIAMRAWRSLLDEQGAVLEHADLIDELLRRHGR